MKTLTEAEFLSQVLQLAKLRGWRTLHVRPSRTAKGWRTAIQGDGVGFPDVLLLRAGILLVFELKVGNNQLSPQQSGWLADFRAAGISATVIRPRDWPLIEKALE